MKYNIWMVNHYATDMFFNKGGRHYWFAENLLKKGYKPTIFCANTKHIVQNQDFIEMPNRKYAVKHTHGIPYVFVKTMNYSGNNIQRIMNMFYFYKNLFPAARGYAKTYGKPDVILASSVHPLTWVAGYRIAKRYNAKFIAETRDLWPETLVAFGQLKRNGILTKILYILEKFIYKKADRLIFTMEGGKEYIKDKGWDKEIALDKICYINNGVDIEEFNNNKEKFVYNDLDLDDKNIFKILYTGSMGQANALNCLVQSAKMLKENSINNIRFILFGDGYHKHELKSYVEKHELDNVIFKNMVEKKFIPNILSNSDLNIITGQSIYLYKYGLSLNKMFDYFASGKPILSSIKCGYDLLKKYNCGVTVTGDSPKVLVDGILKFYKMPKEEYNTFCQNALKAAEDFNFRVLTDKLEKVILELI